MYKKMFSHKPERSSAFNEILSFTYPKLHTGSCWYIDFMAFDPASGKLKRKRIKINNIGNDTAKKKYASQLCHRLSSRLESGWNPWIQPEASPSYHTLEDVFSHYRNYITKLFNDGIYRKSTYDDYSSSLNILSKWNDKQKVPIRYIYQFDRNFCMRFLDYVYIERRNGPVTRNNYLVFLKSFSTFLVQYQYLNNKPTEGIGSFGRNVLRKERTIIPDSTMQRLHDWLEEHNRHFLLLCYFLHYMLIRPKEIALLKLSNINIRKQTIFIPDSISKNRKSAVVTMPAKIIHLMIELRSFDSPSDYFIFSDGFRPGKNWKSEKSYRDYWHRRIRPALKLPPEYKFYSLKDTGITAMLRAGCDALSVKEQARHSSLLMTDIYTPQDIKEANPLLLNYQGIL